MGDSTLSASCIGMPRCGRPSHCRRLDSPWSKRERLHCCPLLRKRAKSLTNVSTKVFTSRPFGCRCATARRSFLSKARKKRARSIASQRSNAQDSGSRKGKRHSEAAIKAAQTEAVVHSRCSANCIGMPRCERPSRFRRLGSPESERGRPHCCPVRIETRRIVYKRLD